MTKVCTHGRDGRLALRQLEQSLRRLQTDYLDLWQIHECVYYNEPEKHFAPGGVVEALEKAKAAGKVRYVGFTGHKDPELLLKMLSYGFPFDSCQLPLNGFDASFRSFERLVLPELVARGIAPDWDEEPRRRRRRGEKACGHGRRSAALCDEPAGGDDRQRHRFTAGAAAEPADRRAGSSRCPKPSSTHTESDWRQRRPTAGSSCTRQRRRSTATRGRRAHGFPPSSEVPA